MVTGGMGSSPGGSGSQPSPKSATPQNHSPSKFFYKSIVSEAGFATLFQSPISLNGGIVEVSLPNEVLLDATLLWKNFIGDTPHIGTVHATVNRIWTVLVKKSWILSLSVLTWFCFALKITRFVSVFSLISYGI